ncbi:MAG: hypothetical protein JSR75_21520 [Proteobacteria bacterium]|nr:hypothetical protein [Pseudomonadota bacterium]
MGEAPGPLGANRTGYPFWGDDCGLKLYELVMKLGLLDEPFVPWKRGADLSDIRPPAGRYAITNACPQMPVRDDGQFCAPERLRLDAEAPRLLDEIRMLQPRVVLACGKAATYTLSRSTLLDGSAPPPLLAKGFTRIRLLDAIDALTGQKAAGDWQIGGALVLVTTHPARGNWEPSKRSGKLHAAVLARLEREIASKAMRFDTPQHSDPTWPEQEGGRLEVDFDGNVTPDVQSHAGNTASRGGTNL